jgi:hypothetical protein
MSATTPLTLARQDGVDGVEVVVQFGQFHCRSDVLGRDPQIQVDMGIHSGQHNRKHDQVVAFGGIESFLPRPRRSRKIVRVKVAVQRVEATCEGGIESPILGPSWNAPFFTAAATASLSAYTGRRNTPAGSTQQLTTR